MAIFLRPKSGKKENSFIVTTFYEFTNIKEGIHLFKERVEQLCRQNEIVGTILIAPEGINGTISGSENAITNFYNFISGYPEFSNITFKESYYKEKSFEKLKVRIKPGVVSFVSCDYNPGTYIEPKDWDEFILRSDVINIDTRNDFEYIIGTFKGSVNPDTENFREFEIWCLKNLKDKNQKIASFCTGGVRCEKSTSWLKQAGYANVYHLKGGIIGYFIETENKNNLWVGDCFVFDDRVIINDKLESF
jgi:UPF0176 protein